MCARRRRFTAKLARDASGATALEFALISPMLILLVVGLLQLGWILHCAASVRWALDASARSLLIDSTQSAEKIQAAMTEKLAGVADTTNLTVTLTRDPTAATITVQSRYDAQLTLPLIPQEALSFQSSVTVPDFKEPEPVEAAQADPA